MCAFSAKAPKKHCALSVGFIVFSTNFLLLFIVIFRVLRVIVVMVLVKICDFFGELCILIVVFVTISCVFVCVCALSKKTLIWLTPVNFPAPLDLSSEHLYMQWYVCEKLCQLSTKSLRLWALLADCTIHNSVTVLYHLLSPHTTSSTSLCNLLEFAKFCLSAIFSGFWYLFLSSLFVVAIVYLLLL